MANKFKPVTPQNMRNLAEQLINHFAKIDCWYEMGIYVANERWSSDQHAGDEKRTTKNGVTYYVTKNIDIKRQMEYSNPDTVSLYFEGPLYHLINYQDYDCVEKLTDKFLKPYGLYFEQGEAWNMAAFA